MTTESIEQVAQERKLFIETFMQVVDKQNRLVPFNLNYIQELQLFSQSPMRRDIEVKPAQVGSTTLWTGVFLADTISSQFRTSVIIAHDEFTSGRLLVKANSLYKNLREEIIDPDSGRIKQMLWPYLGRESTSEMYFPELNSTLYIGSARQHTFGRGEPIHNLLGSEVAFWPNATRILDPAQDRVPQDGGTIILESTPNGEEGDGQFFHDTYVDAKEGQSIYTAHFFPWWFHKEYYFPEGSQLALVEDRGEFDLTEEETDLCDANDLTLGHIRWRRRKMLEKRHAMETGDDRQLFQQEFPEDDVMCWLVSGDTAYDAMIIAGLAKNCFIPKESFDGFAIWHNFEEGHEYTISCDPGMGKQSKTVLHVWEFITDEETNEERAIHCATASGYFMPEIASAKLLSMAEHIKKLSKVTPMIAIETNPPGVPIAYMIQMYPKLYLREDVISGRRTSTIGWLTTPRTKPFMISEMARMLPRLETHDINLVSQFRNMRYIGDRVLSVGPDDHHDAAAIAIVCRRSRRTSDSRYAGSTGGWPDR